MTARPSIFVHFGKHKTGSTSIQAFLDANAAVLEAQGMTVLRDLTFDAGGRLAPREATNCAHLAHLVLRAGLNTPLRLRGTVPCLGAGAAEDALGRANRLLRARIGRCGLMSSEAFSFARLPEERRRFDLLFDGFEVIPLGWFRAAPAWLASWRDQIDKMQLPEAAGSGQGIFDLRLDSWLVDDGAIRAFFGPAGHYLDYERTLAEHGSVLPDFCRITGVSGMPGLVGLTAWNNPRRAGPAR